MLKFLGKVRAGRYKGRGMNSLTACFLIVGLQYYAVDIGLTNDVYKYVWFVMIVLLFCLLALSECRFGDIS